MTPISSRPARRSCFAALSLSFACVVSAGGTQGTAPAWNPKTLGARTYADIDAALKRPFDAPFTVLLAEKDGRRKITVDSCLAWRDARKEDIAGTVPDADYAVLRAQGVDCDALELTRAADAASNSALPADLTSMTDARLYPATMWLAPGDEERERLAKPGLSLAAATGIKRWKATRKGLLLEGEGGGVRLEWIARADFDGDGWEDALYRWRAWAQGGSWTDVRLVVLSRRAEGAPLVEIVPKRDAKP